MTDSSLNQKYIVIGGRNIESIHPLDLNPIRFGKSRRVSERTAHSHVHFMNEMLRKNSDAFNKTLFSSYELLDNPQDSLDRLLKILNALPDASKPTGIFEIAEKEALLKIT